jgi:hypothetical protein
MSSMSNFYKSKQSDLFIFRLLTFSIKTPHWLYAAHRVLFRWTNGLWNNIINKYISLVSRKYNNFENDNSILGSLSDTEVESIAREIDENGFYIFKQKLSEECIQKLVQFSERTPVRFLQASETYSIHYSPSEHKLAEVLGKSARLQHDTSRLLANDTIQKLTFDSNILRIAQEYLGCKPILDLIVMWWSSPTQDKNKFASGAAQKFHFDMDRFKFLKFFVYLTDVDGQNGPHCYVKGSHKTLPAQFRKRGRFDDNDVVNYYGKENVLEICGKKGTMILADTRGLHKGKILESGVRLMFQLEFSNSLFGGYYKKTSFQEIIPEKTNFVQKHYQTYFNFF